MAHWVSVLEVAQVNKGLHYHGAPVPFNCRLSRPFDSGERLYVHGLAKQDATNFTINLQAGSDDSSNIHFHMDVRFSDGVVVLNSRIGGEWQTEVRDENLSFPFIPDEPFLIDITASGDAYDIEINNQHHLVLPYRAPPDSVTHLVIFGDLRLPGVHLKIENGVNAKALSIPGNVHIGSVFYLTGTIPSGSDGFSVNMQCGEPDDSDIALHFNPRNSSQVIVRNSREGGEWKEEETGGDYPLSGATEFALMIITRKETFHMWINGKKFASFKHRIPIDQISVLNVEGKIDIEDVTIDQPPDSIPAGTDFGERKFSNVCTLDLYDLEVPVKIPIDEFEVGRVLCISGLVASAPNRFHINLQYGEDMDADVALHFNPRFDERQIVLNTREKNEWGSEERLLEFAMREKSRFEVIFYCTEEGFQISLDSKAPTLFRHRLGTRLSIDPIKFLVIIGDVIIKRIVLC